MDAETKKPVNLSDLPPNQAVLAVLSESSIPKDQIKAVGEALGLKRETAGKYLSRMKKFDITDDKYLKQAVNVVKKFMKGKVFGDIKEIKDSTVLKAAEAVLDRAFPKQQVIAEAGGNQLFGSVVVNNYHQPVQIVNNDDSHNDKV